MLRTNFHTLIFPKLVFVKEVNFKSWDTKKTTEVYLLDWSFKDNCDSKKFPEKYNQLLQKQLFAIPRKYMEHINYCTMTAIMEWNKKYSFDTMIREICLEPAMAYINVAFKLLCDCAYDEEENKFDRRSSRIVLQSMCLFKFWLNQTGCGLLEDRADINKLKKSFEWREYTNEESELLNDYLKTMDFAIKSYIDQLPEVPNDK